MSHIRHLAIVAVSSLALAGGLAATAEPAKAQQAGEVRCQDDGYIYAWNSVLNMWFNTFSKCNPNSSRRSNRSNYDDEEEDEDDGGSRRSSRRSNNNNNDYQSSGTPIAGDQKCSPDGYVMTYRAYSRSWDKSSVRRC